MSQLFCTHIAGPPHEHPIFSKLRAPKGFRLGADEQSQCLGPQGIVPSKLTLSFRGECGVAQTMRMGSGGLRNLSAAV